MAHVPPDVGDPAVRPDRTGEAEVTFFGLTVTTVLDDGVGYLLVSHRGPAKPLTLLLPTSPVQVAGLAVRSQLGTFHGREWALVWGRSGLPVSGVCFSSGDLRFRRERRSPAVRVGPVWVAVAEGAFREATLDPEGPAPQWLALAPSW